MHALNLKSPKLIVPVQLFRWKYYLANTERFFMGGNEKSNLVNDPLFSPEAIKLS